MAATESNLCSSIVSENKVEGMSHNSKEANNNIELPMEEDMSVAMKTEEESDEKQVIEENEPISLKIEKTDDCSTTTCGKLKVKSFASLANRQAAPFQVNFNLPQMRPPNEIRNQNSNPYSFPVPTPYCFPWPIHNQQRFVINSTNHRLHNFFNPFLFTGHLQPPFPPKMNPPRIQRLNPPTRYVPLKIPTFNLSQHSQSRGSLSPSQPPLQSNMDGKLLNVEAQRPLVPSEPCIRIPEYKTVLSNQRSEIIDVKPDINLIEDHAVKEEVDLDPNVELETSEAANMEMIGEHAEKLDYDIKVEVNSLVNECKEEEEKEETPKKVDFQNTTGKHSCQGCNFACDSVILMKKHRETHHSPESKYICLLCDEWRLSHETFDHLVHHVATVHKGEKRWQCKKCGKSYKSKLTFKNHSSTKCKIIDPYACHECTFTCATYLGLEKHRLRHRSKESQEEEGECPVCNRTMKKRRIKAHIVTHHVEKDNEYSCNRCDFSCRSFCNLKLHYKRTMHNRSFQCPNCETRFVTEEGRLNHDEKCRATRGTQPAFVCKYEGCDKKFFVESRYTNHVKLHTLPDEGFIFCAEKKCDYKCTTQASMDRHYSKTKHYRPFQCPDCLLRFTKESSLSHHIGRLHVAQILKKANALRRTPSPVETIRQDDSEEELDPEQAAVANFQNGWLGISGFDPGEIVDTLERDELDCMTKDEDSCGGYQYVIPEIACIVECQESRNELNIANCPGNDADSETDNYKRNR